MSLEMPSKKELSLEDIELLERQGLHADIRNKLSPLVNVLGLIEHVQNDIKNEALAELIKTEVAKAKENLEHILLSVEYDEKKKNIR